MAGQSFSFDLERFAKKIGKTLDQTHRGVVIKWFGAVIGDTPVDQGTLRGNWNISSGSPDYTTNPAGAQTSSYARVMAFPAKAGTVTFLTNAMPYAVVAEFGQWNGPTDKVTGSGYSRKAPAGMVRKNFSRIQRIVSNSLKEAKK